MDHISTTAIQLLQKTKPHFWISRSFDSGISLTFHSRTAYKVCLGFQSGTSPCTNAWKAALKSLSTRTINIRNLFGNVRSPNNNSHNLPTRTYVLPYIMHDYLKTLIYLLYGIVGWKWYAAEILIVIATRCKARRATTDLQITITSSVIFMLLYIITDVKIHPYPQHQYTFYWSNVIYAQAKCTIVWLQVTIIFVLHCEAKNCTILFLQ